MRCFSSPGLPRRPMYSACDDPIGPGCPIRKSADQSLLTTPHGLSQRATSFIASRCQGIHQMPFRRLIRLQISENRRQKTNCPLSPVLCLLEPALKVRLVHQDQSPPKTTRSINPAEFGKPNSPDPQCQKTKTQQAALAKATQNRVI